MTLDLDESPVATFPKSVQPGIPRLGSPKSGWKTYRFGDLLEVVARPVRMLDQQDYDLVTVKRSRGGIEKRATLTGSEISVKSQFRIEGGDFLISRRQIVHGACAVVPEAFSGSIVSNEYAVLRCKSTLDLDFLKYLTHSLYFQQTCFHSSIGVHVEKMIFKLETWLDFPINIPCVEEQKRLGEGFATVDAKLDALRRKKSGLEAFKSGLMQRLFSQELRFAQDDGTAFPDWGDSKLGKVVKVFSGGTPPVGRHEYYGGIIPFIKSGEIGLLKTAQNISDLGLSKSSAKIVEPGDLLMALYGANSGQVAISSLCGAINQAVLCIRSSQSTGYLFHYLSHNREKICGTYLQGGQGNLSAEIVKSLAVPLPHPDEQCRIANALSSLDAKIAAVADQITHMESFKKGLLQQMFV